ncbi:MAG: FAD-dependent oxidoreductase [Patescibacteria group bacterium]
MQITIVGGGFGGVKAALTLAKNKRARITLITDKPDFQYYPALYGTATGKSHAQAWISLGEIFANYDNINVVIDSVTKLDKADRSITGASGAVYHYSKLILALGSVTTYFGIPGLNDFAYGIKSKDEITRLKQHLFEEFSKPNGADKDFLIVGAGPTGVELASTLGTYLKHLKVKYQQPEPRITISIIEAAPRVLPRMSEKASALVAARLKDLHVHVELNKKVEQETADSLIVSGKPIKSHTVIWTSGVANNPFFAANADQFELSKNGKVVVNASLRSGKDVYVIGDNAFTPWSGLAQTALHDGVFVAKHILGESKKKYVAKLPPVVVPVGEGWAIFEYKKIRFGGWLGSVIRSAADFVGYKDILPLGQAIAAWRTQKVKEEFYVTAKSKAASIVEADA